MAAQSFNHYAEMRAALRKAMGQVVRKAAFDVAAAEQRHITSNRQVDTGFMRSSIYVKTADGSTYGQGLVGNRQPLPEIPDAADETTAYVAVAASYGVHQNYGTSRQPARPFVEPAVEDVRPSFEQAGQRLQAAFDEVR